MDGRRSLGVIKMLFDGLTRIFLKVLFDTSDDEYHFDESLPLHMRLNIKLRAPNKVKEYIDAWNEEINYIQSVFDNMTDKKSKPPIRTNADRTRSMTDEELAEWIFKHDCHTLLYGYDSKDAVLNWLKQEING